MRYRCTSILFIVGLLFSYYGFGQSCNNQNLPFGGDVTPINCYGNSPNLVTVTNGPKQLSMTVNANTNYRFIPTDVSIGAFIEIYDNTGNFYQEFYIGYEYDMYSGELIGIQDYIWSSNNDETITLNVYEYDYSSYYIECDYSIFGHTEFQILCQPQNCINTNTYLNIGDFTPPHTDGHYQEINISQNESFTMDVIENYQYTFSTCGYFSWDTRLTIKKSNTPFVFIDTIACYSNIIENKITFKPPFSGKIRVYFSEWACDISGNLPSGILEISSSGKEYIVNDIGDVDDGVCDSNHCTLREAINSINCSNTDTFLIRFNLPPASKIILTGPLEINKKFVEINGGNLGDVTISEGQISLLEDNFYIHDLIFSDVANDNSALHIIGDKGEIYNNIIKQSKRGITYHIDYSYLNSPGGPNPLLHPKNNYVHHNIFTDITYQAISFSGNNHIFESNHFENNGSIAISTNNSYGDGNIITKNTFTCNAGVAYNIHGTNQLPPTILGANAFHKKIVGTSKQNAIIEIYLTDNSCTNGICQGQQYLGNSIADQNGIWEFYDSQINLGQEITVTGTWNNSTTEFSQCFQSTIKPNPPILGITQNLCPSNIGSFDVLNTCDEIIEYTIDNGVSWTNNLPIWNDGVSLVSRCYDSNNTSMISNEVSAAEYQCTFIVNTTDDVDDGNCNSIHCSLREAIIASSNSINSKILFDIPGSAPHTISILSYVQGLSKFTSIDLDDSSLNLGDIIVNWDLPPNQGWGAWNNFTLNKLVIKGKGSRLSANGKIKITNCRFDNMELNPYNPTIGSEIEDNLFLGTGTAIEVWHGPLLINNNIFEVRGRGIKSAGWVGGSDITISNNYFSNDINKFTTGIEVFGNNHKIVNNKFENLTTAIRGPYNSGTQIDSILISQNEMICNEQGILFDQGIARVFNNDLQPPIISFVNENKIIGKSNPNTIVEVFIVNSSCSVECQGELMIGSTLSDATGNWSIPITSNIFNISDKVTATQTEGNIRTSEFSTCYIILPDACIYAEELTVNTLPCSTTGIVLDLDQTTASTPTPTSVYSSSFIGNDAWYKVAVSSTGNLLIRSNINNQVSPVIEVYKGTCENLIIQGAAAFNDTIQEMVYQDDSTLIAGDTLYLRVWDNNNSKVNGGEGLLHLTAHELSVNKDEWEICDEENAYLLGNPTIISEKDANSFILEFPDNATLSDIANEENILLTQGLVKEDECLCGKNPLQLWRAGNPVDMETRRKSAIGRGNVDTVNYNYIFEAQEFQVNAYAIGQQYDTDVSMDPEGNFVMCWIDEQRRHNYARLYNSSGNPVTQEFRVGDRDNTQYSGRISIEDDGDFITVWHETNGNTFNLYGRQYNADASAKAVQFDISTSSANSSSDQNIKNIAKYGVNGCVDTNVDGNFIVVWHVGSRIFAQRYNDSAIRQGSIIEVGSTIENNISPSPSVSVNNIGDFIIVWNGEDAEDNGIYAQRYDSNGALQGSATLVNTIETHNQIKPDVTLLMTTATSSHGKALSRRAQD